MDWQDIVAFGIVGVTLAVLVAKQVRRRKPGFHPGGGCSGCPAAASASPPSIVLRGRKGGTSTLSVRME